MNESSNGTESIDAGADANEAGRVAALLDVDAARLDYVVRAVVVGTAVGVVGGVGTFMFGNPDVTPFADRPALALLPVILAGVYAHLLSRTLEESFGAAVVGFVVGAAVSIALWLSPVLVLPYSGLAAELMAAPRIRDAVVDVMTVYLLLYGGAYLGAVSVGGLTD